MTKFGHTRRGVRFCIHARVLLGFGSQTTRGANMEDNLKNQYGLFYGDEMVRAGQIAEEAM